MDSSSKEMNYNALISVIVPAFQAQDTLGKCIISILSQSYRKLECLIVVDGATDNTDSIARGFARDDSRVRVIHQKNLGRSAARNNGVLNAHGDWIMFVDADDYLIPGAIEILVSGIGDKTDIVYGNYRTTNGNCPDCSGEAGEFDLSLPKRANLNIEQLELSQYNCSYAFDTYNCRTCWAKLYAVSILKKDILPFPEDIRIGEDTYMNYRTLKLARCVTYIDLPIYMYNDSSTGTVRTWSVKDYSSIINLSERIQLACMNDSEYRLDLMAFLSRDYLGVFGRSSRYSRLVQMHKVCSLAKNACTDFIYKSLPVYLTQRRTIRNVYNNMRIWFIRHNWFLAAYFLQRIGGGIFR